MGFTLLDPVCHPHCQGSACDSLLGSVSDPLHADSLIQMVLPGWSRIREDYQDSSNSGSVAGVAHSAGAAHTAGGYWHKVKVRMDIIEVCLTLAVYFAACVVGTHGLDLDLRLVESNEAHISGSIPDLDFMKHGSPKLHGHRTRNTANKSPSNIGYDSHYQVSNTHRKVIHKRDITSGDLLYPNELGNIHEIAKLDKVAAVLEYIEKIELYASQDKCTDTATLLPFNIDLQHSSFDKFKPQILSAIKCANVLNSFFRSRNVPQIIYDTDDFYYFYLKALLLADPLLYGASIAFDVEQYGNRAFVPYAYRDKVVPRTDNNYAILTKDLALTTKGKYAQEGTPGFDWFWKQRSKNYSDLLWKHKDICVAQNSATSSTSDKGVITTVGEGMWSAPYFSCLLKAWMVTYSAPFFGCRKSKDDKNKDDWTLHFK